MPSKRGRICFHFVPNGTRSTTKGGFYHDKFRLHPVKNNPQKLTKLNNIARTLPSYIGPYRPTAPKISRLKPQKNLIFSPLWTKISFRATPVHTTLRYTHTNEHTKPLFTAAAICFHVNPSVKVQTSHFYPWRLKFLLIRRIFAAFPHNHLPISIHQGKDRTISVI